MPTFHLLISSFNSTYIYTLAFTVEPHSNGSTSLVTNGDKPSSPALSVHHRSKAVGLHSWFHLSRVNSRRFLYCTGWTEPPSLAAYEIHSPTDIRPINTVKTAQRSGYVCANDRAVYSAGAAVGEVFAIDEETGGFAVPEKSNGSVVVNGVEKVHENGVLDKMGAEPIQTVSFVEENQEQQRDDGSVMDFGGVRHGAHSADLSPDGNALYVADIGRNCVWTYAVDPLDGKLSFGQKCPAPRPNDGPRHTWPHPNGKYLYSLQEHSSMVDVFEVGDNGLSLKHVQGVRLLPKGKHEDDFWADEVRLSLSNDNTPKYLYASNRGLKEETKGYLCAFKLQEDGRIDDGGKAGGEQGGLLHMWETPTSGGWANAIQPGPAVDEVEYIALTDSEIGFVAVVGFDGTQFEEVARVNLGEGVGAATAVWL